MTTIMIGMVCKLKMVFTLFNSTIIQNNTTILSCVKWPKIQMSVSINIYWNVTTFILLLFSMVVFTIQWQSSIVATETIWPAKSKIFSIYSFTEIFPIFVSCDACFHSTVSQLITINSSLKPTTIFTFTYFQLMILHPSLLRKSQQRTSTSSHP